MRTYIQIIRRALVLGALLIAGSPPAFAQDNSSEIARLREQIGGLDQKLRVLERQQELKEETSTAAAKALPLVAAGASGFSITSADKAYQLRIRANIQADGRFYLSDSGDDTFVLRRVRPSFEGTIAKNFSFRIMPDFAGSSVILVDAYAGYKYSDALNIQVGKFKVPFDLERLVSQTDLLFVERSYTTNLAPNRDNGVHVFGDLAGGLVSYNLAWVDGTADGGTSITDADNEKEVVGRLFTHPFNAAFPIFANPTTSATKVSSTTLGVNWYLNHNVKLVFNWEHSSFDGGLTGAVTGQDEDAILTRVQLRY